MSYEDVITDEVSSRLKNPILKVLKEIKIDKILKKSNFVKKMVQQLQLFYYTLYL